MAGNDSAHQFEKLQVSKSPNHRRISSSFASLSLHPPSGADIEAGTSPAQHELLRYITNDDLKVKNSEEDLSRRLLNGEDLEAGGEECGEETTISSTASDGSLSPQHGRKASISFAKEVAISDGKKKGLEEKLPRSEPLRIPSPMLHATDGIDWQHANEQEHRSGHTGRTLDRRKIGGSHLSGNGSLRKDSGHAADEQTSDGEASISSAIVASPTEEEPGSSLNGMLSPTSPALDGDKKPSPFWPSRRADSQRSRSYQRLEKAASGGGRRRSTRSANSSISPATAFLSQWSRNNAPPQEEPDDEGQEIADSGWIIGRAIGYGGFSVVKEVSTMDPKSAKRIVRAVKILRKRPKGIKDDQQNERVQCEFEHEVALWRYLRHGYIVPLIAVYDTPFATFCITKLNVGGTLHDLIRSRRQQYSEAERGLSATLAKRYAYQVAAAIRYLHEDARIVHRDIKLENCLLDMTGLDAASQGGNILLCDFGMADYIQQEARDGRPSSSDGSDKEPTTMHNIGPAASSSHLTTDLSNRDTTLTIMGSLEYAAPEVVTATSTLFSTKADIWAYGVCVYALLTGSLPFTHGMREKLALMIEKSQWDIAPLYSCPAVRGGGLAGMAAVELVKGCLTWDVEERWGIREVLGARWLLNCREIYGDGCLEEDDEDGDGEKGETWS